jgi:UDP-N-acetyl-D-glucosamine dehydrogenase
MATINSDLTKRIEKLNARICIMGLGYVGLPLALSFCKKGYFVYGLDTNSARIDNLKKGKHYITDADPKDVLCQIKRGFFSPSINPKVLANSDVVIICVPTPLKKVKIPDIRYVVKASKMVAKYLKKGQLVILESTSYPTTTREVILPILIESGLRQEEDFFLCFSPERVNPGDIKFPVSKIPKVVGGLSKKSSHLAKTLYSSIIQKVHIVSSPEVAESAKLLENTFRLINIALVNEFAIVAHKLGIDIWEVISAAKTKPFGFMPFYPGPGVGGHCIPDDPLYLSWKAKKMGFKTKMIDLASYVNHFMPVYVVNRIKDLLVERKVDLKKARILILGVTYKKDVKDLRESPALDIIETFQKMRIKVDYFDPLVPYLEIKGLHLKRTLLTRSSIKKYDCIVIATDHSDVDYLFVQKNSKLVFDTRNVYKNKFENVVRL